MRLYIDSAEIESIRPLWKTGVFTGVTTNPLLLQKAGVHLTRFIDFAGHVAALGANEIYLQSWGADAPTLASHGLDLSRISDRVVVKLPATREGFEAAARLVGQGVRICITAAFTPHQAITAAAVGAAYVAPYLGRMNDAGRDGHALIAEMAEALRAAASPTEILAASIRSLEDLARLARSGVQCATLSPAVAEMLFREPLTLEATAAFEAAARELAR